MTKLLRLIFALASMLWVMTTAASAFAKDDDTVAASETFRAAEAAYSRGDFEAAAQSFEVSHRLAPHPNAIYNAGLAWSAANQPARAADALTEALAMDAISDAQRADGESRLAELRPKLAIVHVIAPEGTRISVAHVQDRAAPISIHLVPGHYQVTATGVDGHTATRAVDAAAGVEIELDLSSLTQPAPSPSPTPLPDPEDAPATGRNEAQWVSGWILAGAAVVSGGAAIGLGVAALSRRDDFEASGNTDADARDAAATLRTTTNVMWAAAGAFAVTGTLLLVFAGEDASEQAIRIAPGLGSLSVSGRF